MKRSLAVTSATQLERLSLLRRAPSQAPLMKGAKLRTPAEMQSIVALRRPPSQAPGITKVPK